MATVVSGFASPNVILESSWAKMWGGSPIREQVQGFAVAPAGAGLSVTVGPGIAWLSGVLADVDTSSTVTLAPNASGSTRNDLIVVRADWSSRSVTVGAVTGSPGGAVPSSTRTSGTLWEGEVAVVTVASGATTLSAGDIKTVALRPVAPVYSIDAVAGPADQSLPPVEWQAVVHVRSTGRMYVSNGTAYAELTMPDHTHPYQRQVLYGTGNPPTSGVQDGDLYIKYV